MAGNQPTAWDAKRPSSRGAARPTTPSDEYPDTSEEEYQHALEVIFNAEIAHRRKSSLVSTETPARLAQMSRGTACFVHALLDEQRQHGTLHGGLDGIAESPTARPRSEQGVAEPKFLDDTRLVSTPDPVVGIHTPGMHTPGQPDEQAWRRRQPGATTIPDEKTETLASPAAYSRLLTKKQLSDMAWGVRELSKRLGRVNLKLKVRTVFIVTKAHDEMLIHHTREVAKWLLSEEREVPYIVYVEERLRDNKKFDAESLFKELRLAAEKEDPKDGEANGNLGRHNRRLRFWTTDMCRARPHSFDFVITLGGDGTVLYASWLFQRIVPPVLSFSLGSLGFMTKFDFDHFPETLTTAFRDGVKVSLRLRFEATVMRSRRRKRGTVRKDCFGMNNVLVVDDGEEEEEGEKRDLVEELIGEETDDERTHRPDGTYEILNDVIVDRGPSPTMTSIEIFGDDEYFTSIQADGVCVSTPTGSTAYNLAAGGSLCHPENPVILITAICAHTLSFRPIILPDTIVLRVGVPYDARTSSWASFDGRERVELKPGDYVTVSASRYPFANVTPPGRRSEDWVNSICAKLGWNTRARQKAFDKS